MRNSGNTGITKGSETKANRLQKSVKFPKIKLETFSITIKLQQEQKLEFKNITTTLDHNILSAR